MSDGRALQFDPSMVRSCQARRRLARKRRKDVKLGRAERSKLCIYAYVEKKWEVSQRKSLIDNTCDFHEKHTSVVASLRKPDEFARVDTVMALELLSGEMRGYWKYYAPSKWFKQAKTGGKINNGKADLLLDSDTEVFILDAAFARKVGCYEDESRQQECVGIGEGVYVMKGRTKIKDAILGMDFMVPAGIRLDLDDGTLCLPDEICIQLIGRRPLYGEDISVVRLEELEVIEAGQKIEIPLRSKPSEKLWLTRGEHWVGRRSWMATIPTGDQHQRSDKVSARLHSGGMWLSGDWVPRRQGFVTVGSRRYAEW
ncbi:hypothetical protein L916_11046 [Phytophthora nicotianae]|uniref:Peptidase A2 domain-containing protein n=1 Tax=Phytophthora nicotianae TaxID=4792 RepID=W2IUG4_PHYNI|nr:hypothetical protein L916_11046 [Phytophthora nicotianae]